MKKIGFILLLFIGFNLILLSPMIFLAIFGAIYEHKEANSGEKWGKWGYHPKEKGLYDYHFVLDSSERDNKEKVEEVRQINIMFGELLRKISKINTEIFEYNIYPF